RDLIAQREHVLLVVLDRGRLRRTVRRKKVVHAAKERVLLADDLLRVVVERRRGGRGGGGGLHVLHRAHARSVRSILVLGPRPHGRGTPLFLRILHGLVRNPLRGGLGRMTRSGRRVEASVAYRRFAAGPQSSPV